MKDNCWNYGVTVKNSSDLGLVLKMMSEAKVFFTSFDDEGDALYLGQRLLLSESVRSALLYSFELKHPDMDLEDSIIEQSIELGLLNEDGDWFDLTFDDDHYEETDEVRW